MRRPICKVDANQPEIVAALRAAGCTVQHLHTVGHGCPDILVGYEGVNWLIEIKQPGNPLTPDEIEWLGEWEGQACVVYTPEQGLALIKKGICE